MLSIFFVLLQKTILFCHINRIDFLLYHKNFYITNLDKSFLPKFLCQKFLFLEVLSKCTQAKKCILKAKLIAQSVMHCEVFLIANTNLKFDLFKFSNCIVYFCFGVVNFCQNMLYCSKI